MIYVSCNITFLNEAGNPKVEKPLQLFVDCCFPANSEEVLVLHGIVKETAGVKDEEKVVLTFYQITEISNKRAKWDKKEDARNVGNY